MSVLLFARAIPNRGSYGVVSYADSLDCVGVMGQTVDTVRQVFGACERAFQERRAAC